MPGGRKPDALARLVPIMRALALACLALLVAGCAAGPDSTPTTTTTTTAGPSVVVYATMEGYQPHFFPDNVTVDVGDTVLFRVADGRHTVDFDPAEGISNQHSGELSSQLPFAVRFTKAGTFHYHCEIHEEMTGMVNVR